MKDTGDQTLREWRESAPYWDKHGSTLKTMLAPVTRALIEEAGIVSGYRVLDVAGGPGEPALTIAEVVGQGGSVTCTDAIPEMVEAAKDEARRRSLTNVNFRQCHADSLPFDDDLFDAVVSRLGVMFFPDPLAAVREMLRVAKPSRVVSLVVWGRSDRNPFSYLVTNVTARYVKSPPADTDAPGAFRFAESGKLARVLEQAGAEQVRERLLEFHIEAPISVEEFWTLRAETSGTLRENLRKLSEEQRRQVAREVQQDAREFFSDNQMSFPAQMLIVAGRKALPA